MHAVYGTIHTLNHLIEVCKDGEYSFLASAGRATAAPVQTLLRTRAIACRIAAAQLQLRVRDLGGEPVSGGSVAGAVHRGWVAVKALFATRDDVAVLAGCERAEAAALHAYAQAKEQDLPAGVRGLVEQQYEGLRRSHSLLGDLLAEMQADRPAHA